MVQFTLRLLGQFQVKADSTQVTDFHSNKARALLAYLVLEPQEHARTTLATLFWPEIDDKYARTNLRTTLYRLRQTLDEAAPGAGDRLLIVTRQTVQFNKENCLVDVLRFQALLGQEAMAASPALEQVEEAVALYRGELLLGFGVDDAPPFEEWLLLHRELFHHQALLAFHMLATAHESAGRYEQAYAVASRLLILDTYREETHRQLMRLLALMGQPYQALQQLEQLRRVLREEMGVEPSPETHTLAEQIVSGKFENLALSSVEGMTGAQAHPEHSQSDNKTASVHSTTPSSSHLVIQSSSHPATNTLDLRDVPDPGLFFGREREQQQLAQWLIQERCRVVAILGIGGMGKTTLAAQSIRATATAKHNEPFDAIYWRSLVNAPPLTELLPPLLQLLADQQLIELPTNVDEQLRLLMGYLRQRRVLLVLDNMESILEPEQAGAYRAGYEPYGQLIQQMATLEHQSHLLFTSRERPRGYARLERDNYPVQSLQLSGVDHEAGRALLAQRGIAAAGDEKSLLIKRYSGNPLALKLVADTVDEIYGGDIGEFLADDSLIFDDIRTILDQQFERLSAVEQEILFWLAVEREATPLALLRQNLLYPPTQHALVEVLRSLQRRSLVERSEAGFTLQNVVTEYLTDRLVDEVCQELATGDFGRLHRQALLKAQAKEYVRQSQARMILRPIGERLHAHFSPQALTDKLQEHLAHLRLSAPHTPGYAGGNILNLALQFQLDLTGFDFSHLAVWEAYLRGANLPAVNFADAELVRVALGDTFGDIRALAFSPDGQLIAAGTAVGEISLWRSADVQLIATLKDDSGPIWSVAFSPDGTLLAAGGTDQIVRLWAVKRAQLCGTLVGHTKTIRCVAFSVDGKTLASSGDDRTVRLWDMPSGQLRTILAQGHAQSVRSVAFSPDGELLASGSDDHKVLLWALRTGAIQQTLLGHSDWVKSVAFHPDGELLASGSNDQKILLWDVRTGEIQQTLLGHSGWVESVAFSPDGELLASGGDDHTVRLWGISAALSTSVGSGGLQSTLLGHSGWVNAVAFSPDGATLASGDDDRNVYLWDVHQRQPHHRLLGHVLSVESVAFSPDGQILASGNGDQTVRFWHLAGEGRTAAFHYVASGEPIHVGHVTIVDFSPDGKTLASGNADRTIHLIDVQHGQILRTLERHTGWLKTVAFSPTGELLASGGTDQTIYLWDVQSGQLLRTFEGHDGWINTVTFSPDGKRLASGAGDETIRLWDVRSGQLLRIIEGHIGWVNRIVFSPDGAMLISAGADETIRLWDVNRGQLLHTLEGHRGWVWVVALTSDGERLASGGHDGTVRLWDLSAIGNTNGAANGSGEGINLRHMLRGHTPWVTDLAINSPAHILASSSGNPTIRLWEMATGECLQTLKIPGPYEGMNISGVTGISDAQRAALKALGAVD